MLVWLEMLAAKVLGTTDTRMKLEKAVALVASVT